MKPARPVKRRDLPQLSLPACAATNALCARDPIEIDGWRWRFQTNKRLVPNCAVTLALPGPDAPRTVVLALHTRESEFPWWELRDDTRVLAWCAGHSRLLAFLRVVLCADPVVQSVEPMDARAHSLRDRSAIDAGFLVTDERGAARWRGVALLTSSALRKTPDPGANGPCRPWRNVDARLPVVVDRLRISAQSRLESPTDALRP